MNIEYISGFFDADGSITLCKQKKSNKFRYPKIDITNNYIEILEQIQKFLIEQGIVSHISTKPAKKENHNISYVLAAQRNHAIELCKLLKSKHPKKQHRINCITKYYKNVTPRNGKYSEKLSSKKEAFERLFFWP